MSGVLTQIIDQKRREIDRLPDLDGTRLKPSDRDFVAALRGSGRAVIAELKRGSPAGGMLCSQYQPAKIAGRYQAGGAAALSVLTDTVFFGGDASHLVEARLATTLPVLRKDFMLDARQVVEARRMGADACLLIVAALKPSTLVSLKHRCEALGMTALIEIHNEDELELALDVDPQVIAINNRSLRDLTVDRRITPRLCDRIPRTIVAVSASGVETPQDIHALPPRIDAVLVGSALMRAADPAEFLRRACQGMEAA